LYDETGGAISATTVNGGYEAVLFSATATGTLVEASGNEIVSGGGTAIGTTLSGGSQYVYGSASGTQVDSGGFQSVQAGGSAVDTTIGAGGFAAAAGGVMASATVLSGGQLYDEAGGTISSTAVSGGFVAVLSGGVASATTLSGGVLEIASGGSAGLVTFSGGGELLLEASASFGGMVSGFTLGDSLDFAGIAFNSNTTLAFSENSAGTGGTLTVSNGTQAASILLLGQYIAGNFSMANDGQGGTIVTDPPAMSAGDMAAAAVSATQSH
jgi:autotransporter passenger strand-loop-strand repeat protein